MKKFLLGLFLAVLAVSSSFAKSNLEKLEKNCVYFIYKIQIRNDINRDFFSKAFLCPESAEEPHTSGAFNLMKETPLFETFSYNVGNVKIKPEYNKGSPIGDFTYCQLEKGKDYTEIIGLLLQLFGSRFTVDLPLSNNIFTDEKNKVTYNKVNFDADAKYVYAGTFVYDFVDGTVTPKLVKVVDEYDAAKEWINQMAGEEVKLCRAAIE